MRMKFLFRLSVPISTSLLAQVAVVLVNAAMLGRLGTSALAGAGIAGEVYAVFAAILFGIDTGVQAMVARRAGEGRLHLAREILVDAVAISVLAGLLLTLLAMVGGSTILGIITRDPAVVAQGAPYLRAISPALLFVGANYAFSAYWNGSGAPKYALMVTAVQLVCNIVLGAGLIFGVGPFGGLGTAGAGWAALLAAMIALGMNLVLVTRVKPVPGLLTTVPSWRGMATIFRIGSPISLEQSTLHFGTATFFAVVAMLGAHEVAVVNVVIGLDHLAILPAIGVGIATATMVGMSLGGKDTEGARRWGWEGGVVGLGVVAPVTLALLLFPGSILQLFLHDPQAVALGLWPTRLLALSMLVNNYGRVVGFGIRGSGSTMLVAAVNFAMQWLVQLPVAWVVGVRLGYGLTGIALARLVFLSLETAIIVALWRSGRWKPVSLPSAVADAGAVPETLVATIEPAAQPAAE